ncbi:VOC family protein [Neobacillus notoginsengisoli]|uniref:VOC family protein n=1 Tax=Neobacillus notoginsengisoli TaxID=1578198 RepID=A0A417YUB3_9BACI|nr:VOC family protein [Neobacillus notoginsengisoli]RHW40750.1 VOC family protein [Neobacillus notoginsengisoli]
MAELKLDHAVHYVNDLNHCINIFHENGLAASKGGSHTKWGTHNALSYFELFYVEFLGIEDIKLAKNPEEPNLLVDDALTFLPENEVLARLALRTDDIEEVRRRLLNKGADLSPITYGKRLNAQGQLIEWRMMMIEGDFNGLSYPFIIQWNGNDQERLRTMIESGVIRPHPGGEISLHSAVFEVSNPLETAAHWQELFTLSPVNMPSRNIAEHSISGSRIVFKEGHLNRLSKLVFRTNSTALKGTSLKIGQGEYEFI